MKITMCGRPGKCCPVYSNEEEADHTLIGDDGQKIEFTDEQWKIFKQNIIDGKI